MRRSRHVKRYNPDGLNARILGYRSWCRAHQSYYPTNIQQPNGHIVANDCPACTDDERWFNLAWAELRAEGRDTIWRSEVIARGEQLAGHELRKYRYG